MAVSQALTKNPIILCGSSEEIGEPCILSRSLTAPYYTPQHQLSLMTFKGFSMELPVQKIAGGRAQNKLQPLRKETEALGMMDTHYFF